jgi:hypothetical protein
MKISSYNEITQIDGACIALNVILIWNADLYGSGFKSGSGYGSQV